MRFLCFLLPVILFCAILSHSLYNLDSEQKFCMILYFFLLRLFTFYFILIKSIGWRWLTILYMFQVCNSMIYCLYFALCARHPSELFLHHVFGLLDSHLPPLPSVTTIMLSMSMSSRLFFLFVHLCVQFYIPHMSEIIWFLIFSDLFPLAITTDIKFL